LRSLRNLRALCVKAKIMDKRTNSKDLFRHMVSSITIKESTGEVEAIAYLVLHSLFGLRREHIMINKEVTYDESELNEIIQRINTYEPIQYILNEAEFCGRLFYVNKDVLIPRPETEILVREVIDYVKDRPFSILDIGTGSGCIAVTLACEMPNATIMATDISSAAIDIAHKNSLTFNTDVEFFLNDVLSDELPAAEIIVSNPPYIAKSEQAAMSRNVVSHEPHLALFVSDDDPLVFYRSIAEKSKKARAVFVEINERFGTEVKSIFEKEGFEAAIIKDIDNKDRIIKAVTK
jgi:release factor glutamine methyltransferase